VLICHGSHDLAVPIQQAYLLKTWCPSAELFTLPTDHVFERKHPWTEEDMPRAMEQVLEASIRFLKGL
jgi:uncharacterized protein